MNNNERLEALNNEHEKIEDAGRLYGFYPLRFLLPTPALFCQDPMPAPATELPLVLERLEKELKNSVNIHFDECTKYSALLDHYDIDYINERLFDHINSLVCTSYGYLIEAGTDTNEALSYMVNNLLTEYSPVVDPFLVDLLDEYQTTYEQEEKENIKDRQEHENNCTIKISQCLTESGLGEAATIMGDSEKAKIAMRKADNFLKEAKALAKASRAPTATEPNKAEKSVANTEILLAATAKQMKEFQKKIGLKNNDQALEMG